MCIYRYIYIHLYTHIYINTFTYIHMYIYAIYIYTYKCTYIWIYIYSIHMCIYICTCVYAWVHTHTCMHACIHPSTHIYIFTYIHYIYAYKPYIFTLHIVVYRHTTQSLRSVALPLSFQIPVSIMSDMYGLSNSTASIAQEVMITKQNRKDQQRVLCCGFPLGLQRLGSTNITNSGRFCHKPVNIVNKWHRQNENLSNYSKMFRAKIKGGSYSQTMESWYNMVTSSITTKTALIWNSCLKHSPVIFKSFLSSCGCESAPNASKCHVSVPLIVCKQIFMHTVSIQIMQAYYGIQYIYICIIYIYMWYPPFWNLPFWHIHKMVGSKGGYLTYMLRTFYVYIYIY